MNKKYYQQLHRRRKRQPIRNLSVISSDTFALKEVSSKNKVNAKNTKYCTYVKKIQLLKYATKEQAHKASIVITII